MENKLRETARKLLTDKTVDVVIGYGVVETGDIGAIFVTDPDETSRLVWNTNCRQNLVAFLKRAEVRKLGKPAVVVKGCDARAIVVLANESQIERDKVVVIGMACNGIADKMADGSAILERCQACNAHMPKNVDYVIGESAKDVLMSNEQRAQLGKHAKLAQLQAMSSQERLEYWKKEFSRCIRCYACRQSCPLCYCNQCVVDKNRPVRIETSSTLKGNFAWNILRAFHLAGRCVGCGACSNACPVGIDLDLLNLTLVEAAQREFHYLAGQQLGTEPLIGTFSEEDKEDFIR